MGSFARDKIESWSDSSEQVKTPTFTPQQNPSIKQVKILEEASSMRESKQNWRWDLPKPHQVFQSVCKATLQTRILILVSILSDDQGGH